MMLVLKVFLLLLSLPIIVCGWIMELLLRFVAALSLLVDRVLSLLLVDRILLLFSLKLVVLQLNTIGLDMGLVVLERDTLKVHDDTARGSVRVGE